MKSVLSVLVGELSGSAGGVTASRWKGRSYFRQRVTPANPNTDDQKAQRRRMARVVNWWQDLVAWKHGVTDTVDKMAEATTISGFNTFVARNVKDLFDAVACRIFPTTADLEPAVSVSGVPGTAPGSINFTVTGGPNDAAMYWLCMSGPTDGGTDDQPLHLHAELGGATTVGAFTLNMESPGTEYRLYLAVMDDNTTATKLSTAVTCLATSQVA
jgi:hypothetical protein